MRADERKAYAMPRPLILIIEDDADVRAVVRCVLRADDYAVCEAADGPSGIALARQTAPTLILLDLGLPGLDGWEVTRLLRADPAFDETPIISMTAYAMAPAIHAAERAGCQTVISKPFNIEYLANIINSFVTSPRPAVAA
jgi:CheY-like chemotaxis protein